MWRHVSDHPTSQMLLLFWSLSTPEGIIETLYSYCSPAGNTPTQSLPWFPLLQYRRHTWASSFNDTFFQMQCFSCLHVVSETNLRMCHLMRLNHQASGLTCDVLWHPLWLHSSQKPPPRWSQPKAALCNIKCHRKERKLQCVFKCCSLFPLLRCFGFEWCYRFIVTGYLEIHLSLV